MERKGEDVSNKLTQIFKKGILSVYSYKINK